jgi:hypothetical protein
LFRAGVKLEKRVTGDLKLLVIQKLLKERKLVKEKFSKQFSRVEQLLQLYRCFKNTTHL